MKFRSGDIDIDFSDRQGILNRIDHVPAAMRAVNPIRKHSTGVYVTKAPYDPVLDMCTVDYAMAEDRGYFKLDMLNVFVYSYIKNEAHLLEMMKEPDWTVLKKREVVLKLIHLANHANLIQRMPEPIDSIPRLAMFLALIRPAKKHLIGKKWSEIARSVWDKDGDGDYAFRHSHSVAYAQLVVVHMNLLASGVKAYYD